MLFQRNELLCLITFSIECENSRFYFSLFQLFIVALHQHMLLLYPYSIESKIRQWTCREKKGSNQRTCFSCVSWVSMKKKWTKKKQRWKLLRRLTKEFFCFSLHLFSFALPFELTSLLPLKCLITVNQYSARVSREWVKPHSIEITRFLSVYRFQSMTQTCYKPYSLSHTSQYHISNIR